MKLATPFACSACGFSSPKWFGRCPDCGDWSTATAPSGPNGSAAALMSLAETRTLGSERLASGISEFDRVLGGGLVAGEVLLLAGQPGIGKSTLVLQVLTGLAAAGHKVVLASAEETLAQVGERARRLAGGVGPDVTATDCASVGALRSLLAAGEFDVVAIDSIQALHDHSVEHGSGSVVQVRESVLTLATAARASGTALILTGHVTKDGSVAGPKIVEHVVDAVVNLDGERGGTMRLLRGLKNRYGSCDETGVFQMTDSGLEGVDDPSRLMLADRGTARTGCVVFPAITGTRAVLVEVQALVVPSDLPQPRRVAIGVEPRRLTLTLAVLNQCLKTPASKHDVFVAVAGGIVVREPAVDLALVLAILSAAARSPLDHDLIAFGELGLTGEVRSVPSAERRLSEASRLGFGDALIPPGCDARDFPRAAQVRDVRTARDYFVADGGTARAN